MKILAIGGGHWGKNIIRNLDKLQVLGGIVEASSELAQKYNETYPDQKVFSSLTEALYEHQFEAVTIATPAPTHFEIAQEALSAQLDVFVEKPITLSLEDAEKLHRQATENQKVLMVGHLLLYQPAVQFMKEFISEGKLGQVHSLHQRRLNFGRARDKENALWSLGVHDIAVLLYLHPKKLVRVQAVGQAGLNPGIEDFVHVSMRFEDDSLAEIQSSWLWPDCQRNLTVVGERGMLFYNELEQKVHWHKQTIDPTSLKLNNDGVDLVFEGSAQPLKLELEHFIECCSTRATPRSSSKSALTVIEVLEKASQDLQG